MISYLKKQVFRLIVRILFWLDMIVLKLLIALVIVRLIGFRDSRVLYIFILIIFKYMFAEIVHSRTIRLLGRCLALDGRGCLDLYWRELEDNVEVAKQGQALRAVVKRVQQELYVIELLTRDKSDQPAY